MAAPRTQKRASASAGRTTAKRGSGTRASTSRTSRSSSTKKSSARAASNRKAAQARAQQRTKLTALFVIGSIVVAAWTIYPVFRLQYEHQREVRTLEAELVSLKTRNGELREEVDQLKTPEGVEQLARETLGLVKPGEQAYVVTGGSIGETTATPEPETERRVWQGVLDTLFGLN